MRVSNWKRSAAPRSKPIRSRAEAINVTAAKSVANRHERIGRYSSDGSSATTMAPMSGNHRTICRSRAPVCGLIVPPAAPPPGPLRSAPDRRTAPGHSSGRGPFAFAFARIFAVGGGGLRQMQTGRVQNYGLVLFGGLALIAVVLVVVPLVAR